MDDFCRTCMLNSGNKSVDVGDIKMMSIFVVPQEIQKEVNLNLREILKNTVPQLKIEDNDKLPQYICQKCSEEIIEIYNFQQKCIRVEERLYKLLADGDIDDLLNNRTNQDKDPITEINNLSSNNNSTESIPNKFSEIYFSSEDYSNNSDGLIWNEDTETNCTPYATQKEEIKNKSIKKNTRKKVKQGLIKNTAKSKQPNTNSKQMYPCDKCQRKLKSKLSLKKHYDMHTKKDREESELRCGTCNQAFSEITILKNHQRTHMSKKPFLCSQCGKGFTSAGSLKQHSFRHLDTKLYPCPDCPKSFPTNGDLLCHYEIHKAKPRIHVCDVCGRGFYKPFLLKQHQRYHSNERPFACEFCDKRFVTSEKQRRHTRTHTGEKPYRCKYCERAFAQSNDCIKHLRQHLGDNVYQCELCPLRFPLARDLRSHFSSHKDDSDEIKSQNLNARIEEEQRLQMKLSCQDL